MDEIPKNEARATKPAKSNVDAFLDAAGKLGESDIRALEDRGWGILRGDDGEVKENWGYLCSHCGEVAIVFPGSKFQHQDGSLRETLPPGAGLNKLRWRQNCDRALVNREHPICPACRAPLAFDGGSEKFLRSRLVRNLVVHRQTEAENRKAIEEHRTSRRKIPVGTNLNPRHVQIPT